ncbi:MAG TPA: hypothetical protein PLW34_11410 [Termitinemataceae bacterium]|nr:hypothetical protein [Termitinemataceae bacterium]HOM24378.1 hypothetical protein [Termitinemataceae bacterium]HPQ01491.1 hypothetical protein [Termitinemataceae bacterium]
MGDTNRDGSVTKPTVGDWYGIWDDDLNSGEYRTGDNITYATNN